MNKIEINFENCFGIKKLNEEFNFTNTNKVNAIYAKNGLMKTSFTKVFKKIQDSKENEIGDEIFNNEQVEKEIKVDGELIKKENIFVINSFESQYESSSISSLLVNDEIKNKLEDVLILKSNLLKKLEDKSGLKISKIVLGKKVFELENQIIKDFNLNEKSFLNNLNKFKSNSNNLIFQNVSYLDIFDSSVMSKIEKKEFQSKISDYLKKTDEVYKKYSFFEKGVFSLSKLKNVNDSLKKNSFFVKNNKIQLGNEDSINDIIEFEKKLKIIEGELKESKEFQAIEKGLSDVKGSKLKDVLESNVFLIEELKASNLLKLKNKIWYSYFESESELLSELSEKFNNLKSDIESINVLETDWQDAINIFNDRFSLPFKMEIENLNSCIIGESLPKVIFKFCTKYDKNECQDNDWVKLSREELESKNTLSQGEKRSLYLLNIIFDVQKRIKEDSKTLFIIDDIADSFDYKNKYAIIEYLNDISKNNNFYLIVLSHNFDFYRTVCSRLNLDRNNRFHAVKKENEIVLNKEHYQDNPFITWKKNLSSGSAYTAIECRKHIISLIPFIRNIIEYGVDYNISIDYKNDYMFLTNLLHNKSLSKNVKVKQLQEIFKKYLNRYNFDISISENENVYDIIIDLAENYIDNEDFKLENKIILAIAIRLKAEEFMKNKIKQNSTITFNWIKKGNVNNGNSDEFLDFVELEKNQTRTLFDGFKQIANTNEIKIVETVNIMTPENIHLNSFMYEPILDMDIYELKSLYHKVNNLYN